LEYCEKVEMHTDGMNMFIAWAFIATSKGKNNPHNAANTNIKTNTYAKPTSCRRWASST
jgi:hypothetical protein